MPSPGEGRCGSSERRAGQSLRSLGMWIHEGTFGNRVNKDRVERGENEGLTVDERARLAQLERENAELRYTFWYTRLPHPADRTATNSLVRCAPGSVQLTLTRYTRVLVFWRSRS